MTNVDRALKQEVRTSITKVTQTLFFLFIIQMPITTYYNMCQMPSSASNAESSGKGAQKMKNRKPDRIGRR